MAAFQAASRILLAYIVIAFSHDQVFAVKPNCPKKYLEIPGHTRCKPDSQDLVKAGVNRKDRELIVNLHNKLRSEVEPPATDMPKLVWDRKLAAVAQKLSNQCVMKHDGYGQRKIPAYDVIIGQNVAAGKAATWEGIILAWHGEYEDFEYGKDMSVHKIGHYTQVVHNTTSRVGCGYAQCQQQRYFVCNYAMGQGSTSYPYTKGERCANCPNSCENGLCNCGGKLCRNGGVIDIDTCECKCPDFYKGKQCQKLECPEKDKGHCRTQWPPSYCDKFQITQLDCPWMCGRCK